MQENLDIVSLIESNPLTRIPNDYQCKFIEKVQQHFTESEQRLFLSSFYCYLNYNSKSDFVIDLDDIWKWLGFSRKDPAKRAVQKFFTKDTDYKIALHPNVERKNEGGFNRETVLLNIETFKTLCMLASTSKGKEVRNYFLKLEDIMHDLLKEESEELRKRLTLQTNKSKEELHNLILTGYDKRNVVYVGDIGGNMVKYGWSNNLSERFTSHKGTYGSHFKFLYVIECDYNKELELRLKRSHDIILRKPKDKINGKNHVEIIQLDDQFNLSRLKDLLQTMKVAILNEKKQPLKKLDRKQLVKMVLDLQSKTIPVSSPLYTPFVTTQQPQQTHLTTLPNNISPHLHTQALFTTLPNNLPTMQLQPQTEPITQVTKSILSLKPLPRNIGNMREFYASWISEYKEHYAKHLEKHGSYQWVALFGKQQASSITHRLHNIKDWLALMDKHNLEQQEQLFKLFEEFASEHKMPHSVVIKRVYYSSLRPWTSDYDKTPESKVLKSKLTNAGYDIQDIERRQRST